MSREAPMRSIAQCARPLLRTVAGSIETNMPGAGRSGAGGAASTPSAGVPVFAPCAGRSWQPVVASNKTRVTAEGRCFIAGSTYFLSVL